MLAILGMLGILLKHYSTATASAAAAADVVVVVVVVVVVRCDSNGRSPQTGKNVTLQPSGRSL